MVIQLIRAGTLCCHFCCAVAFLDLFLDFLSAGISSQAPGSPPIPIPTPKSRITTNKQPQHHFWDTSPDPNGIFPQTWVDFPSVSLLCFAFPFVFFNPHKISIKLLYFPSDWISYVCLFLEGRGWRFVLFPWGFGICHPSGSFPRWIHGNLECQMGFP